MKVLEGRVAIAAGASRGAGRGIARALGEAGAVVYVAARSSKKSRKKGADEVPGTIEETAAEVTARGGKGIPVRCDFADEKQVSTLFKRVERDYGRLDVFASSIIGKHFVSDWGTPFWEIDSGSWRAIQDTIASCWFGSQYAARMMVKAKRGVIIHVTDNMSPDPHAYRSEVLWDLAHEAVNRLVFGMSDVLTNMESKIAVVGLNPGFMRTERVWMHMTTTKAMKTFRFDLSETTEYIGRAVVALARDKKVAAKNGKLLWVADLAQEYGFTDVDGRTIPRFDPQAPMQKFPEPNEQERAWQKLGMRPRRRRR